MFYALGDICWQLFFISVCIAIVLRPEIHRLESVQRNLLLCSRCNLLVWHTSNGGNAFFILVVRFFSCYSFCFSIGCCSHSATVFFCCFFFFGWCLNHFDWKYCDFFRWSSYVRVVLCTRTCTVTNSSNCRSQANCTLLLMPVDIYAKIQPWATYFFLRSILFVCLRLSVSFRRRYCYCCCYTYFIRLFDGASCVYECPMNELGKIIVPFAKRRKWRCNICIFPSNPLIWVVCFTFFCAGGHNYCCSPNVFAIRKAFLKCVE